MPGTFVIVREAQAVVTYLKGCFFEIEEVHERRF